jgi:AraC family transcriptional regulator
MPAASRLVDAPAMRLAGFADAYPPERLAARLPLQWARLMGASPIAGQVSDIGYGIRIPRPDASGLIHYIAAVEVAPDAPLDGEMTEVRIPPARYQVIDGFDHVSELRSAWTRIACSAAVPAFERFGEGFDPMMGRGDMSLWVPVDAL